MFKNTMLLIFLFSLLISSNQYAFANEQTCISSDGTPNHKIGNFPTRGNPHKFRKQKIKKSLANAPGCKVVDTHKDGGYITPAEIDGDFITYISRIREDKTQKNTINMWVVSDNLLKGAALNAVQIAQLLCEKYLK